MFYFLLLCDSFSLAPPPSIHFAEAPIYDDDGENLPEMFYFAL